MPIVLLWTSILELKGNEELQESVTNLGDKMDENVGGSAFDAPSWTMATKGNECDRGSEEYIFLKMAGAVLNNVYISIGYSLVDMLGI